MDTPALIAAPTTAPEATTVPTTAARDWEAALFRRIEAGTLAAAALDGLLKAPTGTSLRDLLTLANDGRRARTEFAERNTLLVWYTVLPIAERTGLDRDELFQEGVVGLLEAIDGFDPERASFATWALPRIRMRVWDSACTVHGSLGLPARRARQWRRVLAVQARLATTLARMPQPEEIAVHTGDPVATVRALLAFAPASPLTEDQGAPVAAPAASGGDGPVVQRLLRRLDDGDRAVVAHLFGLDGAPMLSHADVARTLGRSESTIRRRERIALKLLRAGMPTDLAA